MTQTDLPYDYEDFGLTPNELSLKYAKTQEHPEYSEERWRNSAEHNDRTDYWEWVKSRIQQDDDAMPSTPEGAAAQAADDATDDADQSDIVKVDDISTFAEYLFEWHTHAVTQAQQMLTIPQGTEACFSDSPGAEPHKFILEGDAHRAFQIGVMGALNHLGVLPFHTIDQNGKPAGSAGKRSNENLH